MTKTIKADKTTRKIAKTAYPDWRGRKLKVEIVDPEETINCSSYWDGGSRDYYVFVALADGLPRVTEAPAQSAYDPKVSGLDAVKLPQRHRVLQAHLLLWQRLWCHDHGLR